MNSEQTFDEIADRYACDLNEALSISGESNEFFARGRIEWMTFRLNSLGIFPSSVLDYGCGVGGTTKFLRELLGAKTVTGIDVSARSIRRANEEFGSDQNRFSTIEDHHPNGSMDVAYCNGVFHHIPLDQRDQAVNHVFRSLRPGGIFAFWENNIGNPATRYVMSRCKFDVDAVPMMPSEARRLLRRGGFEILRTDFRFIFPRSLRWFRSLEPSLASYPLGTQFMVLCRKPSEI